MFVILKLIVALVLIIIMFAPSTNIKTSDNKIIERNTERTEIVLVDNAIVTHYYHHTGNLPNNLSDLDTLANINKSKYTFNKISNNRFQLTMKDSKLSSPNTDKDLPILKQGEKK